MASWARRFACESAGPHILASCHRAPALVPPSKNSKQPSSSKATKLARIVAALKKSYGPVAAPPAPTAFAIVLWEKVAYLAPDAKRVAAYRALEKRVGLTP